jgi:hypothetical protein
MIVSLANQQVIVVSVVGTLTAFLPCYQDLSKDQLLGLSDVSSEEGFEDWHGDGRHNSSRGTRQNAGPIQ